MLDNRSCHHLRYVDCREVVRSKLDCLAVEVVAPRSTRQVVDVPISVSWALWQEMEAEIDLLLRVELGRIEDDESLIEGVLVAIECRQAGALWISIALA